MADKKDLVIEQGRTFELPVRWETDPVVFKDITAITQTAPAQVTCPSHGVPNGWRVAIQSVKGMTEINAPHNPPWKTDFVQATVATSDILSLTEVNAADYDAYTSGGYVRYYTPKDMTGFTAKMTIRNRVGGTELLTLSTENGRIAIDNVDKKITLTITAADTEALTWTKGVYDLELKSSTNVETVLLTGSVSVTPAITLNA